MRYISLKTGRALRLAFCSSLLTLCVGLAGCDLPGANADAAKAGNLAAKPILVAEKSPSPSPMVSAISSQRLSFEKTFADALQTIDMPPADEIEITPLEKAGLAEGNALFTVRFPQSAELPDAFEIEVDQREYLFKRNEKEPWAFDGLVHFDFDRFIQEQEARAALLDGIKAPVSPRFSGREMIGEEPLDRLDPQIISLARQNQTSFRISRGMFLLPRDTVEPARELLINDISVVQDPTRTFDLCAGFGRRGNPAGAWTFNKLMTDMANQTATGVHPSDFVENWLKSWATGNTVNTHAVESRTNIGSRILSRWGRTTDGKLKLEESPFRLLAIVNRLDLRSNPIYGGGNSGELRFVFGVLDRGSQDSACSKMPFTVILEYGVPLQGCSAVKGYATLWDGLTAFPLGSPEYNTALQSVTDISTTAGAAPWKPNGSAINQVRSNEIALSAPWELREFEIRPDSHLLKIVPTEQTPAPEYNKQPVLNEYMRRNTAAILADRHTVPSFFHLTDFDHIPLLAGATPNEGVEDDKVWESSPMTVIDTDVRHKFSLATCNGCHGGEARNHAKADETKFVHIDVRDLNRPSALSKFLTGDGTLALPSTFAKKDPVDPAAKTRRLGDLMRRQIDLANLMAGSCDATGLLNHFSVEQLRYTH